MDFKKLFPSLTTTNPSNVSSTDTEQAGDTSGESASTFMYGETRAQAPLERTMMKPTFVFVDNLYYSQLDILRILCMSGPEDVHGHQWRVSDTITYFLIPEAPGASDLKTLFPESEPEAKSIVVSGERLMERCAVVSQFEDCTLHRLVDAEGNWDLEIFCEGNDPLVLTFTDEALCRDVRLRLEECKGKAP